MLRVIAKDLKSLSLRGIVYDPETKTLDLWDFQNLCEGECVRERERERFSPINLNIYRSTFLHVYF